MTRAGITTILVLLLAYIGFGWYKHLRPTKGPITTTITDTTSHYYTGPHDTFYRRALQDAHEAYPGLPDNQLMGWVSSRRGWLMLRPEQLVIRHKLPSPLRQ